MSEDTNDNSEQVIEIISKDISNGSKIYSIEDKGDYIYVSTIKGVDMSETSPNVLVNKYNIKKTPIINDFLSSETISTASLNPLKRGIILIDIIGYSKGNTLLQGAYLSIFNEAINSILETQQIFAKDNIIEQIIPTGDGCYLVCNESINDRFFRLVFGILSNFHVHQNRVLKDMGLPYKSGKRLAIRVGCILGEVDFITDVSGNRNCFGIGMNEAARVLSCGQKYVKEELSKPDENTLFFDDSVLQQAQGIVKWIKDITSDKNPAIEIIELGMLEDKHHFKRNVWWMCNIPQHVAVQLYSTQELYNQGSSQ